jgi:hypothetical protein
MRRIVMTIMACCVLAISAYPSESCGIGTAIKKLRLVEHPVASDFEMPGQVILQEAGGKAPFHFCDYQLDLKPGIAFMNKYVDKLISSGASEDQPDIIAMRHTVATMKELSAQREMEKKQKKNSRQ